MNTKGALWHVAIWIHIGVKLGAGPFEIDDLNGPYFHNPVALVRG
jgi:hypothetical protein